MTQSYKTGTVTVAAGSDIVIGSGTAWALALVTGGLFCCAGMSVPCTMVDDTHLTLDYPWPGANGAGLPYSIFRETAQAASAVTANDRLAEVADRLNKLSYINFDAMGTLAQRAAYEGAPKDFIFLDVADDPFELYIKASDAAGDWAGPNVYGQGAQGPAGPVTPIEFDPPEALAPGSDPTVTNSGTALAPKLKFGLPRGEKGQDGTGTGDVVGPASSMDDTIPLFDGTTGKLIKDSGKKLSEVGSGDVKGPSSSEDGALVRFDGTTGKLIKAGDKVANSDLADMATARLKGRVSAGSGSPEDLTAAQAWGLLGATPDANLPERLRGYHPSTFTDANDCVENGFYKGSNTATNIPTANSGMMLVVAYAANNLTQVWTRTTDGAQYRRKCVAGTWSAWEQMYGQRNVVGVVSETGGVPTGAIIEGGGNVNGSYVRYADGTQICQNTALILKQSSSNFLDGLWTFPAEFLTTPTALASFPTSGSSYANLTSSDLGIVRQTAGASGGVSTVIQVARTAGGVNFPTNGELSGLRVMAIGRWF